MKRFLYNTSALFIILLLLAGLAACGTPGAGSVSQTPEADPPVSQGSDITVGDTSVPTGNASGSGARPGSETPSAGDPSPGDESAPIPVKSISIKPGSTEVVKGAIIDPKVEVLPADATDKSFTLTSGDEAVLRLVDGRWIAVGAGTAQLTATAENGVSASVTIVVTIPVESLSIGDAEITIERGTTFSLSPVITPNDATNQLIRYTSSKESIASVSSDGMIRANGAGVAVIEGTVGGVSARCTVTVTIPVDSISVSADRRAYLVGDQISFYVDISPQDATDKTYTVDVRGADAGVISEQAFSCGAGGDAIITVTAANGVTGRLAVTIVDPIAYANEVLRLTNIERANEGLSPLSARDALTRTAVVRANEIIRSFAHERPDGRSCFTAFDENGVTYFWAGENIAAGQKTPAEVVRAWMDSPGHRENILSGEFGHLGVGVAMDSNGRLYWSQNFTD